MACLVQEHLAPHGPDAARLLPGTVIIVAIDGSWRRQLALLDVGGRVPDAGALRSRSVALGTGQRTSSREGSTTAAFGCFNVAAGRMRSAPTFAEPSLAQSCLEKVHAITEAATVPYVLPRQTRTLRSGLVHHRRSRRQCHHRPQR